VLLIAIAEVIHAWRVRRVAGLAFGPSRRPRLWAFAAPPLRALAVGALCWGLITLMFLPPKVHRETHVEEDEYRHLLLVLDVSPSMKLKDAGATREQSRTERANDLMESFFSRAPIERYKITVVAVYTEAKPVVIETTDLEVVRNILSDLPMSYAFKSGTTDLFKGLEVAADLAKPWPPRRATLMVVTDGDTVPATGLPPMPASVRDVVVVGVGDPHAGSYIEGHQSRQDVSTLRQLAIRTKGTYHDGNTKHLPTELLRRISETEGEGWLEQLTRREYALMAIALGATTLAVLPLMLHYFGTRWRPGVAIPRTDS
jgi:Ca-activated chloride channel family protein